MRTITHPLGFTQPSLFDRLIERTEDPDTGVVTETPFDLSAPEVDHVQFHARVMGSETDLIDDDMAVVDADNGEVRYDYKAGDVATEADCIAWEVIHFSDGSSLPFPAFVLRFRSPSETDVPADWGGPCEPWITGDDVLACVQGDELVADVYDIAAAMASTVMFDLSGRQYSGRCTRTVRPCYDPCNCGWGQVLSRGHMVGWSAGRWTNDCGDRCGCGISHRVRLAGVPIISIDTVKVNGETLDETAYRLDAGGWLSRVDGDGWPLCQATGLADTERGTFSVAYTWGARPPLAGKEAAKALAVEIAAFCVGGECNLPTNLQSVSRQGISMTRSELMNLGSGGATGLPAVDMFLAARNPRGMRRRPAVFSPDIQPHARRY